MPDDNARTPLLLELYEQYLEGQDSAAFAQKASRSYNAGTLERLTSHHQAEVRRAAVLAVGLLGDYLSNACLGRALLDSDRCVRTLAESSIRAVWLRDGDEEDRRQLGVLVRLNAAQHYHEAISRAGELIDRCPWLAEAWHQRAVAHFNLRQFAEAIRDCHESLEINPYHFLAAASMGRAYLELQNPVSALESFRRALRLNADMEGVRSHVVRLARLVEGS